MITIELNLKEQIKRISLKDEILFNALLSQNDEMIKRLIKSFSPLYKISDAFYDIVNRFVDVTDEGESLYAGLIVRTSFDEFVVLYLEDSIVDEDYLMRLIEEYIHDTGENVNRTVTINKMEIDKDVFLKAMK